MILCLRKDSFNPILAKAAVSDRLPSISEAVKEKVFLDSEVLPPF